MGGFHPVVASEELASLLQDLPPGQHIAVTLGEGLQLATALRVSRRAAAERGDHFMVVGDRAAFAEAEAVVADSLGRALRVPDLMEPGRDTLLVVDAHASVRHGGAEGHADAERALTPRPGLRLTIICFYTEEALAAVGPQQVGGLHARVASPGQV